MPKVEYSEIKDIYQYEKIRPEFRRRIIELKKKRRVEIGDKLSLTFENHDTVLFQIQEMVRAERIVDEEKIKDEVDVYNQLIPEPGELSATLFIEIREMDKIKEELDRFHGIDSPGCVYLKIGDRYLVPAIFESGRARADKVSAVHYLRFRFAPEQKRAFLEGDQPVELVVDHPNYRHRAVINPETLRSLAEDLEGRS